LKQKIRPIVEDLLFTGTITEGTTVCQYVNTETQDVQVSSTYKVLTRSEGDETGWKWAYYGDIPENAVPCADSLMDEGNCYLGVSLYSDGICDESIGKIDAKEGMIYMSVNNWNKPYQLSECPFYMYLTVKVSPIELVEIELLEEENFLV